MSNKGLFDNTAKGAVSIFAVLLTALKLCDRKNQSSEKCWWIFSIPIKLLGEAIMEKKDLKKLLASLGVAGLISMGGITLPGAHAGSGWGAKTGAGSTEKQAITPAGSGGSGTKAGAVSAEEQKKMEQMKTEEQSAEEKAKKAAEEEAAKKKTGKSGWGGNKWSCRMHDKKNHRRSETIKSRQLQVAGS
jgi:radical SAM modification target selenobiotic family peptide